MKMIRKLSIVMLFLFLAMIGTSSADTSYQIVMSWFGEYGPIPGPAYFHCDGDIYKVCIKKSFVRAFIRERCLDSCGI